MCEGVSSGFPMSVSWDSNSSHKFGSKHIYLELSLWPVWFLKLMCSSWCLFF